MTVKDILKQSGLTDDQISALDSKIVSGFETVLTTATTAEQAANAAKAEAAEKLRIQQDIYAREIAPALDAWGNDKATLEAQVAFYKTQAEGAKGAGFLPKDAPGFEQPKDPASGRFVAGANPVPGSPGFTAEQGLEAIGNATWFPMEYQRLYGTIPPDDFLTIVKEAGQARRPFKEHVEVKYKFPEKRQEIAAAKQKEHDDKIRAEQKAASDKEWAEKVGNNPGVRVGMPSQYDKISAGVKSGALKDPLTMSPEQRRLQTSRAIQTELASQATQ